MPVTDFSGEDKASGVKFCTVVQGRPGQGISYFGELGSRLVIGRVLKYALVVLLLLTSQNGLNAPDSNTWLIISNTLQSAWKCYCAVLFIIKERHSSTSKHPGAYFRTRPPICMKSGTVWATCGGWPWQISGAMCSVASSDSFRGIVPKTQKLLKISTSCDFRLS